MPAKKPKRSSHVKDVLLLFAIPVGIAVFAAAVVYTPRLLANPKHDFIYSVCSDYACGQRYEVDRTGKVTQHESDGMPVGSVETLRYYDVEDDSTRSLSVEEAQRYQLDTSSKSPDGYSVAREYGDSGFLFWIDSSSRWYLKDGAKKRSIELSNDGSYYSDNIRFLGWVTQ